MFIFLPHLENTHTQLFFFPSHFTFFFIAHSLSLSLRLSLECHAPLVCVSRRFSSDWDKGIGEPLICSSLLMLLLVFSMLVSVCVCVFCLYLDFAFDGIVVQANLPLFCTACMRMPCLWHLPHDINPKKGLNLRPQVKRQMDSAAMSGPKCYIRRNQLLIKLSLDNTIYV